MFFLTHKESKDMSTEEVLTELQTQLMGNPVAASLFGYKAGESYDSHFGRVGAMSVILYVVAYVVALKERLLEQWKEEVRGVADSTRYGTEAWWKAVAKAWREGEQTEVVDGAVGYAHEATAATVTPVAYAAVTANGRMLTLKVAADDGGTPTALTETQVGQLQGYVNAVKPLGIAVRCVSGEANPIAIFGESTITYNPEVSQSAVDRAVREAIDRHCAEIEFGGTLYVGRLVAAIMQAEGVIDCHIDTITICNGADPGSAEESRIGVSVQPYNGYCRLDAAKTRINYVAYQNA